MDNVLRKRKGWGILLFLSLLANIVMIYVTCVKTDLCNRVLAKFGLADYNSILYRHKIEFRCLEGWANTLDKLDYEADVVFYGNSITYESDLQKLFPKLKICNLGCYSDDLDDLIHRSFLIKSVKPHKIFILGGINRLQDVSLDEFANKYALLVDTIIWQNPTAKLYLQSLLPVNVKMEIGARYADCVDKIKQANIIIRNISHNKKCMFVDIYSAYQEHDSLPREYTRDGLHLKPEAYAVWAQTISPLIEK